MSKNLIHEVDVSGSKKARFGMACFWAPDSLFGATLGVLRTRVGYSGGKFKDPTYRNLGDHTEAIDIDFDPKVIDFATILDMFWKNHDPTAKNKTQYTSIIFYHDDEQKKLAEKTLEEQKKIHSKKIVTTIVPAQIFYDAEDYHQKYRLQQHTWLCESIGLKPELLKTSTLAARLNGYVLGCGGVAQFEKDLPSLGLDDQTADYVRRLVTKYEGHGLVC